MTIENSLEKSYFFNCRLIVFTFIGRPSSHSPLRKERKDSAANLKAVSGDNKILIARGCSADADAYVCADYQRLL